MKKFILIMITTTFLLNGCFNDNTVNKELQEVYTKRFKAYEKYVKNESEKAVALAKKNQNIIKEEKNNIDVLVNDLKTKINSDEFIDFILKEKNRYLKSIENLSVDNIKVLEDYLESNIKVLENDFLMIRKEKQEKLKIIEEEKKIAQSQEEVDDYNPSNENRLPSDKNSENMMTIIRGILIVNKKHPLPYDYNPGEDPTAARQIKIMIHDMQNNGFDISNSYSGFRSYSYQKQLYENYVNQDGREAADRYSARPGHSEHQTGLTYDLLHSDGTLVQKEAEVNWISSNAQNYGFIVRYQANKENITGYQAEPWHLRYIGDEAAAIANSGLSLEEYLKVEGGDYFD